MFSFDIFDTLITRKVKKSTDIFIVMQMKIAKGNQYSEYIRSNFAFLRISAEQIARLHGQKQGREEIGLYDIYDVFQRMCIVKEEDIFKLIELEIHTELENIVPLDNNVSLLKQKYFAGEKIILISDMYLSQEQIREMLLQVDEIFANIKIYVSSEWDKTKSTGSLFLKVRELENAEFNTWTHYGDNLVSDFRIPRLLGINAIQIIEQGKNIEPLIVQYSNEGMFEAVVKESFENYRLGKYAKLGVYYGGNILYPYVEWLIRICIEMEIDRLYFVARDGYILKLIADIVIQVKGLQIKTAYLYGSRKVWSVVDKEMRKKSMQYLLQEIDLRDDKFAFVELNGTGKTMGCVAGMLVDYLCSPLKVFYYSLSHKPDEAKCNFLQFCPGEWWHIELLCRAPYGVTLDYKSAKNRLMPILDKNRNSLLNMQRLEEYAVGVALFTQNMVSKQQGAIRCDYPEISYKRLLEMIKSPHRDLTDFFGDFPHGNQEDSKYAPILRKKDIFMIYLWRTNEDIYFFYTGTDLNFSYLRMKSNDIKWMQRCCKWYDSIAGEIIHKFKHRKHRGSGKGKRIIIYAAGKNGKRLYDVNKQIIGCEVKAWVDIAYDNHFNYEFPIVSLKEALNNEYDHFVVTISVKTIKNLLIAAGVQEDKIMSASDFYSTYLEYDNEGN